MHKVSRLLYWAFALVVILSMAACAAAPTQAPQPTQPPSSGTQPTTPPGSGTPTKLTVWVEMSDNPQLFQDAFAKYAKENNVQIEVVVPAPMDKILAALSGSDAPDIIAMSSSTLAQSLAFRVSPWT